MNPAKPFFLDSPRWPIAGVVTGLVALGLTFVVWMQTPFQHYLLMVERQLSLRIVEGVAGVPLLGSLLGLLASLVMWRGRMPFGRLLLRASLLMMGPVSLCILLVACKGFWDASRLPCTRAEYMVKVKHDENELFRLAILHRQKGESGALDLKKFAISTYLEDVQRRAGEKGNPVWVLEHDTLENGTLRLVLEGNLAPEVVRRILTPPTAAFMANYPFDPFFWNNWIKADSVATDLMEAGELRAYPGFLTRDVVDSLVRVEMHAATIPEPRMRQKPYPLLHFLGEEIGNLHFKDESILGQIRVADTALFHSYLRHPKVRQTLPPDFKVGYQVQDTATAFMQQIILSYLTKTDPKPEPPRSPVTDSTWLKVIALRCPTSGPQVDGANIIDARVVVAPVQQVLLEIRLSSEGSQYMGRMTQDCVGSSVALLLDDKVVANSRIHAPVRGGALSIQGGFTFLEANDYARSLMNSNTHGVRARILSVKPLP